MIRVLDSLAEHARRIPHETAVSDTRETLSYRALGDRVAEACGILGAQSPGSIAILADNGIDWIVADLGAAMTTSPVVPVPPFFTSSQIVHLLHSASVDTLLAADAGAAAAFGGRATGTSIGGLGLYRLPTRPTAPIPSGTAKVTFTSGSTGEPRGVCLSGETLGAVSERLLGVVGGAGVSRHLCSMPLATLLENVAGVYVPLMLGATVLAPSLRMLGLYGSSRIDAAGFASMIAQTRAESLVLQPQVLRELTSFLRHTGSRMPLRFVAVGGARIAAGDLLAARAVGIPAYQGYGLSECGSVVALNTPGRDNADSVGRPLPGLRIDIAEDGEIIVRNQAMTAYLGEPPVHNSIATGDLGHIDDNGYLYVTGRKKNVFITSFGRNVSPEWPESELLQAPGIEQVCVIGEARSRNTAIVVTDAERLPEGGIEAVIDIANTRLPDYARIADWIVAEEAFSPANGLLTAGGKLRRQAIADRYVSAATIPDHFATTHRTSPVRKEPGNETIRQA